MITKILWYAGCSRIKRGTGKGRRMNWLNEWRNYHHGFGCVFGSGTCFLVGLQAKASPMVNSLATKFASQIKVLLIYYFYYLLSLMLSTAKSSSPSIAKMLDARVTFSFVRIRIDPCDVERQV